MNFIKSCDEKLDDIVLNNTKITEDYLDEIADREYYMFAKEALDKVGLIPELLGRLPVVVNLEPLNHQALKDILTKPDNAITKQYQELFALFIIFLQLMK